MQFRSISGKTGASRQGFRFRLPCGKAFVGDAATSLGLGVFSVKSSKEKNKEKSADIRPRPSNYSQSLIR
jgi:hypothetical protein